VDYTVMAQPKAAGTAGDSRPLALEIAAAAYDADGRMLNGVVDNTSTANAPSAEGAGKRGFYRAQQQIDVPASATSIRVAVRETSTDHIGALEVALPLAPEPQAQATTPAQSAGPAPGKPN
jgi:hypothetical protein